MRSKHEARLLILASRSSRAASLLAGTRRSIDDARPRTSAASQARLRRRSRPTRSSSSRPATASRASLHVGLADGASGRRSSTASRSSASTASRRSSRSSTTRTPADARDRGVVAAPPHLRRLRPGRGLRAARSTTLQSDAEPAEAAPTRPTRSASSSPRRASKPLRDGAHERRDPHVRARRGGSALGRLNDDGDGALSKALADSDPRVKLAALGSAGRVNDVHRRRRRLAQLAGDAERRPCAAARRRAPRRDAREGHRRERHRAGAERSGRQRPHRGVPRARQLPRLVGQLGVARPREQRCEHARARPCDDRAPPSVEHRQQIAIPREAVSQALTSSSRFGGTV